MWLFLELWCVCVYLCISHQWGKLQHLFLFLLAHDTQLVFFGSGTPQILAAKFFGSMLNAVTQWLPSFQHEQKQIIVFINSCRGDAPTQAASKDRRTGHVRDLSRTVYGLDATQT